MISLIKFKKLKKAKNVAKVEQFRVFVLLL